MAEVADSYVVKMGLDPSDLVEGAKEAIDQINEVKKAVGQWEKRVLPDGRVVERYLTRHREQKTQDPNARANLAKWLEENSPDSGANGEQKNELKELKKAFEELQKKFEELQKQYDDLNKSSADFRKNGTQAYQELSKGAQSFGDKGSSAIQRVERRAIPLGRRLKMLRRQFAMLVYPVMGFLGVRKMFNEYLKGAESVDKVSKKIKMSISDVDAWSKATEAAGGSASAFQQALSQFVESGKGSAEDFFKLGDAYRGVSEEQQDAWLKSHKLSKEAMEVFRLGAKEAQNLANSFRATAFTPEDAENARRFKIAWQQVHAAMAGFGTMMMRLVMPAVNAVSGAIAKLADFARKHFKVVEIAADIVGVALGVKLVANIRKLSRAVALFGKSLLTNPLTWYIAAIALLALALEDLWGFANGHDSLIEELLGGQGKEQIEDLRKSAKDLFTAFGEWWDALAPVRDILVVVLSVGLKLFANFIGLIARLILAFTKFAKAIGNAFKNVWRAIKKGAVAVFDWLAEKFKWLANIPFIRRWLDSLKSEYIGTGGESSNAPVVAAEAASSTKNVKSDTKVTVNNNFNGNVDSNAVQAGMRTSAKQAGDLIGMAAVDAVAGQSA